MQALALTTTEAGYVLDRSPKGINKAIDDGIVRLRFAKTGRTRQRLLGAGELRYLGIVKDLAKDLTLNGHKRLYTAVRDLPTDIHELRLGNLIIDLAKVDADLSQRVQRLEALRQSVEKRASGDVIKGTSIPVHLIAALARGQTTEEIGEDYPELSPDQISNASEYAKAFPKLGRPYPTRSFKRMIGDAATAGVFDDEAAPAGVEPQRVS